MSTTFDNCVNIYEKQPWISLICDFSWWDFGLDYFRVNDFKHRTNKIHANISGIKNKNKNISYS